MKKIFVGLALLTSFASFANSDCTVISTNILMDQEAKEFVLNELRILGYSLDDRADKGISIEMGMQIQGETQRQECTNCGVINDVKHRVVKFFDSLQSGKKSQFLAVANEKGEYIFTHTKSVKKDSTDMKIASDLVKEIPSCEELIN